MRVQGKLYQSYEMESNGNKLHNCLDCQIINNGFIQNMDQTIGKFINLALNFPKTPLITT